MSVELAYKLWSLSSVKVCVIGDAIIDTDLVGSVSRCAVESPGTPIFKVKKKKYRHGGAGAVAEMVKGLGGEVTLLTGNHSQKVRHWVKTPKGLKLLFRSDEDLGFARPSLTGKELEDFPDRVTDRVTEEIKESDCVLVADYGKGICTEEILRAVYLACHDFEVPLVCDPHKRVDWSVYGYYGHGYGAIKCNRYEYSSEKAKNYPVVVRTEGSNGLSWLTPLTNGCRHFPARKRVVKDVTGCGDMILAALGVCLGAGFSWPESCQIANAAAGLKVERHGAVPVSRAEVCLDLLESKIVPPSLWGAPAKKSKKLVLATGCFDLLHPGHVSLLERAKSLGDTLVVGVNSDESVKRLKGGSRPKIPLRDRLNMLAALGCVDWVTFFEENTPESLIRSLAPRVFVKGGDYTEETLSEANLVKSLDGEVVILPLVGDHSSSKLISKLIESGVT